MPEVSDYKDVDDIFGKHPENGLFASYLKAEDSPTLNNIPHRALSLDPAEDGQTLEQIRRALVKHHASKKMLDSDKK